MKTFKKICLGVGLAALFAVVFQVIPAQKAIADTGPFAYKAWDNASYVMNNKNEVVASFKTGSPAHDPVTFTNSSPGTSKRYTVKADNRAVCSGYLDLTGANPFSQRPNISASISVHIVQYRAQGGVGNTCVRGGDTYTASIQIKNGLTATGGAGDTGPKTITNPENLTNDSKTYTQIDTNAFKTVYGASTSVDSCYGGELLVLNKVDSKANAPVTGKIVGLALPPFDSGKEVKDVVNLPSGFPLEASKGICKYKSGSDATVTVSADGTVTKCTNSDGNSCLPKQKTPAQTDTTSSCESNFDSGFEWVLCPMFKLADSAAGAFNSFIEGQLCFKTTNESTSSTGNPMLCSGSNNLDSGVHNAWNIFKNLASALIVIALLIMVISQAIGGGPFDAYTIRKMLPKLVAAVIIMQISWFLLKWAIDLSNDAGAAIGNLIMAPFGGESNLNLDHLMGNAFAGHMHITNDTFAFFTVIAAGTAAFIVSIPTLGLMALYVVMALLTAFIVLIFRKLLIILLVILAPLAFVAWVMPGMDKYWTMWRTQFTKLLLMFPMIMGLIAAGRIFASITSNNTALLSAPHLALAHLGPVPVPYVASVTSFVDLIIIIGAYFAPYFFLPQTYKWGGTAMASIAKGVQQGVEKSAKPAKDYLDWRKNFTPWKMARQQRRALTEQRIKDRFADRLAQDDPSKIIAGTRARFARGRLYGLSSRKANKEIVAHAVRSARTQQAQEAGKDVQGYFEALALDTGGKGRGSTSDFQAELDGNGTAATAGTALGQLGKKLRSAQTNEEVQAILKKVAQYKDVGSVKVARQHLVDQAISRDPRITPQEAWSAFANSGFLYDDFKKLDAQLLNHDGTAAKFFSGTSIDHSDELLAGQSLDGWHDFWLEATTVGTPAEIAVKTQRALEAMERVRHSPAGDNLDNKVRDFMDSVTPAPPPAAPVPGPGAAPIPTGGAPIPHGSPSAEIVQADDVEIQRRVRAAGGWAGVSAPDLLRIYRYRTGSLKDGAEQELRNRGLFP